MSEEKATYQSPLSQRYATEAMQYLFSPEKRFRTWRRVWIALAEAEKELGLPIEAEQIEELRQHADDLNLEVARAKEKELRHDVMAHVHAYGEQCPTARPIIHLGATSCTVTDNADLIILREGLQHLSALTANVIDRLALFAREHKDLATLGFTHLQPAQCTTVGKRACLWIQDLLLDLEELENWVDSLTCLGAKGTTGTQASFLDLFGGDHSKVQQLDSLLAEKLGFERSVPVSGQTYPRKIDDKILGVLSGIAQSASKFAADIRILSSRREIEEPFKSDSQIGSSAMPYKQNPMRCERISALSRFVMSLQNNTAATAANQWFERTLDDSANRRLVLPEGFLATDAILNIFLNVVSGLRVYPAIIRNNLERELPFMATEELLMRAVKAGGDRQALHEKIRSHAVEAARIVKEEGGENDLLDRLRQEPEFAPLLEKIRSASDLPVNVGRAPEQVEEFLEGFVKNALSHYGDALGQEGHVQV